MYLLIRTVHDCTTWKDFATAPRSLHARCECRTMDAIWTVCTSCNKTIYRIYVELVVHCANALSIIVDSALRRLTLRYGTTCSQAFLEEKTQYGKHLYEYSTVVFRLNTLPSPRVSKHNSLQTTIQSNHAF